MLQSLYVIQLHAFTQRLKNWHQCYSFEANCILSGKQTVTWKQVVRMQVDKSACPAISKSLS